MNGSHCKHGIVKTDCETCTTENIKRRYSSVQQSTALLAFLEGFAAGFDRGQSAASAYEWGHGSSWNKADIRKAGEEEWQDAESNQANAHAQPERGAR